MIISLVSCSSYGGPMVKFLGPCVVPGCALSVFRSLSEVEFLCGVPICGSALFHSNHTATRDNERTATTQTQRKITQQATS